MPTLHVSGLAKSHGSDVVFADVSLRVPPGDRLAIVGRNGAGKTTLLRILAGEVAADAGEVNLPKDARVALHDQRPPRASGKTLAGNVGEALADVHAAEAELGELEKRMAAGAHDDATLAAYARAQATLEHAGGYGWRVRIESILRGLGFGDGDLERRLDTFSGGELTRASLARVLAMRPAVLLLDEPTNHLDLRSLEWLEREVQEMDCSILMVSHDRWFLESVTTGVLELDRGRGRLYPMKYSKYREQRVLDAASASEAFERQQEEIKRLERFVTKFRAGTRARQAKSVEKRIARIERVEKPRTDAAMKFGFPKTRRPGRVVLEVEGLDLRAGEKHLLDGAGFHLERGARCALIGPNGAGKTTLLETLVGRRRSEAGTVKVGYNVDLAYFTQHAEELPESATVLEAMCLGTPLNQNQARTLLGRFLFPGADVEKRVGVLSGGERRRLSLARLVSSGANLLVLDEPTNHLDVESREALEDALEAFDGTVLMVSHDRALIDTVADETLSVEGRRLVLRPGDYNDYLRAIDERPPAAAPSAPAKAPRPAKAATATPPAHEPAATSPSGTAVKAIAPAKAGARPPQRLVRRIAELERKIAAAEAALVSIERDLADPAVLADRDLTEDAGRRHLEREAELAWLMREWEDASEAAEGSG